MVIKKLNVLLNNFPFTNEDAYFYLNMINYRLIKLLEIHKENINNGNFNNHYKQYETTNVSGKINQYF